MHCSLSLTFYWCSMSRHVSGITCPSSGGTTRTLNGWLLFAVVDVFWCQDMGRLPPPGFKITSNKFNFKQSRHKIRKTIRLPKIQLGLSPRQSVLQFQSTCQQSSLPPATCLTTLHTPKKNIWLFIFANDICLRPTRSSSLVITFPFWGVGV
jgi:hypothetical protein